MNLNQIDNQVFKWLGCALVLLGLTASTWIIASNPFGLLVRYYARYVASLDRKLHLMFIWTPGRYVAYGQIAGIVASIYASVALHMPSLTLLAPLIAVLPNAYINKMREQRITVLESQLDGFLTALSNALKSIPSISTAFASVQPLLQPPMRDEIDLAIKEMRVGSTMEQALHNLMNRVGSRQIDSAISAILIGKQIGGDMARVLETTAATLREMARLEGVVRTKTAEGRAQMWVLGVFPFAMVYAFNAVREGYFASLSQSFTGYFVAFLAGAFWVASLIVARKVLSVHV